MKKYLNIRLLPVILIILLPVICSAQGHLAKATRLYDDLAYAFAIPEYQKALKSDENNPNALIHLAHCYRLTSNAPMAEKYYAKVVQLKEAKPAHYMYYTQALMTNGNYAEAETWIKKYIEVAGKDYRTERILESLHHIKELITDSSNYVIEKLKINSPNSDISPVFFREGLVFVSSRKRSELVEQTHEWSGLPFMTLYYAQGKDIYFDNPRPFASDITTKYNNGTLCFNKAQDELYVTRNNIENGKIRYSDSGIVQLKIYHYKMSGFNWREDVPFPYNNDNYNCAHPCISPDGNELFFSSDMPGGIGGMDLYVCRKTEEGWGKPVNLGPTINSRDNDAFPFIDQKDGLFYASEGLGGLGGYDIFYSKMTKKGYSKPVNLGYPINSSGDDFCWVQKEDGSQGYFASNRETKDQNDEIYSFMKASILMNMIATDSKTKRPLVASKLTIIEKGRDKRELAATDSGTFNMEMSAEREYKLIVESDRYQPDTVTFDTRGMKKPSSHDLTAALNKILDKIRVMGRIFDKDKNAMANVEVKLKNKRTGEVRTAITDKDGNYVFEDISVKEDYRMEAIKYPFLVMPVDITGEELVKADLSNSNFSTELVMSTYADVIKIDNIYYDLDKYYIRHDAELVLDDLVTMLKTHPDLRIELRSHTDCRQTDSYNMLLSTNRAKSAVEFLIKNGIARNRLRAKGYGETIPVVTCDCSNNNINTGCTEEEHQLNRRTEFKVITELP